MMKSSREYDEGVLKALSNSTRRGILRLIAKDGKASYSQMMMVLGFDPMNDSGTFNYHLKEIADVGLIERVDDGYKITELGKKVIILMDQIKQEPKVDQYGVLSAAIAMTPRDEVALFKSQFGTFTGCTVAMMTLIVLVVSFLIRSLMFVPAFVVFTITIAISVASINKLVRFAKKYNLGLSSLLLISESWFLIRSPNRGNFLAAQAFGIISVIFASMYFFLVALGVMQWLSALGVVFLAIIIFTAPCAFILIDTAIKKAEALEMSENEQ
ncbi:MAG: winged helix-turn-helix domain-containing protein [Candidatus Thorarchaeota archaeon]